MVFPEKLHPGDTVSIIAPCSPVAPERVLKCKEYVESMGYSVIMGESTQHTLHGYLAGDVAMRAQDINSSFENPNVKAIFCIRGGYGGNQLMNLLDYDMIRNHPKIFVGYSDITSFHLAFHSLCNMVTYHGPMVSSNMIDDFDQYTKCSFFNVLNQEYPLPFHNPVGEEIKVLSPGLACGEIIGGCLSLVSPAIGTFYQPDFQNKILFLEDVDESLPRCDKMIEHLFHAGIFDQVSGVILGDFMDCNNGSDLSYTISDYFRERFQNYNKPVMYNIQSGHCIPMATIPFGSICRMDTERRTIIFYKGV